MKLLVIGIDGGTKEIIEQMPMPFTQSLFKQANYKILSEDLLSRGWAEILTGCDASENRGLYQFPLNNKSYEFGLSYSRNKMVEESPNPPLWKMLNDNKVSVGILNVPTTTPADNVNGFFVSGGGGGVDPSGEIPEEMVFPKDIKEILEKNQYISDIRFPDDSKTIPEFFNKITFAEEIQKNTFLELAKKFQPEFGFHCFRMTTEIQFMARYEINRCIEAISKSENKEEFKAENSIHESIIAHYKSLDKSIKEIFDTLQPQSFLFVGDHSTALFEKDLNLDVWLKENNYLKRINKAMRFMIRSKNSLDRKFKTIFSKIGVKFKPEIRGIRKPLTRFKPSQTTAFGTFYDYGNFAGIFINDEKRFGGPVKDEADIEKLVLEICEKFNADPITQKYNLSAEPYRSLFKNTKYYDIFPDIRIKKPDTIYGSSRNWQFMLNNPNLKPFNESLKGIRYPYTGLKGSDPIFLYSKDLEKYINEDDPNNLRLAYFIIKRYFSN